MNKEMRETFEQAFAEFEAMNDSELNSVLEDKAYDGLYHNITKMTAGAETGLAQRGELKKHVRNRTSSPLKFG